MLHFVARKWVLDLSGVECSISMTQHLCKGSPMQSSLSHIFRLFSAPDMMWCLHVTFKAVQREDKWKDNNCINDCRNIKNVTVRLQNGGHWMVWGWTLGESHAMAFRATRSQANWSSNGHFGHPTSNEGKSFGGLVFIPPVEGLVESTPHGSCSGGSWWPNNLLKQCLIFLFLICHLCLYIAPSSHLPLSVFFIGFLATPLSYHLSFSCPTANIALIQPQLSLSPVKVQ